MVTIFFLPVQLLLRDFFQFVVFLSESESCSVVLCNPVDCSPPASSVHGILQAGILEWGVIPFSRGSSLPRDQTQVSCIVGGFFTIWATREACSFLKSAILFPLSKSCFCPSHISLCWEAVTLMACKHKENIFRKTLNVDTQRHHLLGQTLKTILKTEGKPKIKTLIATELWQFSS